MYNKYLNFLTVLVTGYLTTSCSYSSGNHTATTHVIPKAFYLSGNEVRPDKVRMQVAEEVKSEQQLKWREFGVMTDRKSGITTDRYGAIKQYSKAEQTEDQTGAVSSIPRHIVWALALGGMFDTMAEFMGAAFEVWSNNDTAVELEKLEGMEEMEDMTGGTD